MITAEGKRSMEKEKVKWLVLYLISWFLAWNLMDFLWTTIIEKGVYRFVPFDNLVEPLLIAIIVWVIAVLKPWQKKEGKAE